MRHCRLGKCDDSEDCNDYMLALLVSLADSVIGGSWELCDWPLVESQDCVKAQVLFA